MNIVLGFGTTETDFESQEIDAFQEQVAARYRDLGCDYITKELVADIKEWADARGKGYRDQADRFKAVPDHPPRYSFFRAHIASSASAIVCIFNFSHINRRHAMSPDGWALMQIERLTHVFSYDIPGDTQ